MSGSGSHFRSPDVAGLSTEHRIPSPGRRLWCSRETLALATRPPTKPDGIDDSVQHEHRGAQRELHLASQSRRIKRRGDVVLDEAAAVARLAASPPQPHL